MGRSTLSVVNCTLPLDGVPGVRYAIRMVDERIASVARMEDVENFSGEVLDADGRSVLPGFTDAHVHLVESGVELARCDLSRSLSRDDARDIIGRYCADHPDEEWIVGRGWSLDHFQDRSQMSRELDALVGGRPAYLSNKDGHSAWVNSKALELAGIHGGSVDPVGGRIERDPQGEPNGLLHESAMLLVSDLVPPLSDEARIAGLLAGQAHFFSLGITGWQEAIIGDFVPTTDVARTYQSVISSGGLHGQVTGNLWLPRTAPADALEAMVAMRSAFEGSPRFRASGVKVMYDGVCETLTGAVSEPYIDSSDEPNLGITFFEPSQLAPVIEAVHSAGFDIHAHVIGDRASDEMLSMIEDALSKMPRSDHRHQLAHLQLLNPALIERIARARVIANVQPYWAQADAQMTEMTLPFLAPALHTYQYALASLERAGVPLAFGSDWPVTTPNPFDWVHVAVNRSYPGESHEPFIPSEALSRESALRAATKGSAFAARQEDSRGEIKRSHYGDLAVLDVNLEDVRDSELCQASVAATIVRGDVVYER